MTVDAGSGITAGNVVITADSSANATFTIEDEVAYVDCLRLQGPLFRMDGFGTVTFGGTVDLTLRPQFIKSLLLPGSSEIPGVRELVGLLPEDPLYVVRVHGDVSSAKTTLEPLPFLIRRRGAAEFQPLPFEGKPERRIPRQFR